jgi:hypothetical protein
MEFYDQVETINGKSNNIGTYKYFLVIIKNVWCSSQFQ